MAHYAETDALKAVRDFLNTDRRALCTLGATPPRALLLIGPPGVGKTKAVQLAAAEQSYPVLTVTPGRNVHDQLHRAFNPTTPLKAKRETNLVFVDEIDAICPLRATTFEGHSFRTTALLLSYLDPLPVKRKHTKYNFLVIAATNRPNAIDSALRRPGRFDLEVTLMPPTAADRYRLLTTIEPAADTRTLREIADKACGFVAADLVAMCKRAREKTAAPQSREESGEWAPLSEELCAAFTRTKASVLRDELSVEVAPCDWDSIGGLSEVKKRLRMGIEWPLKYATTFERLGMRRMRGILLYGPPGCSKTSLVRVAASQSGSAFLRLSGADIYSCYVGEAERVLREAFGAARAAAPCILFLDEIEAIVGKRGLGDEGNGVRERVLSMLLTEMDGVAEMEGVLVIGATNRVDLLDGALLRPGRFDDILEVGLPDEKARLEILEICCRDMKMGKDVHLKEIARRSRGRSGAELKGVVMEAGMRALREGYAEEEYDRNIMVRGRHFEGLVSQEERIEGVRAPLLNAL